MGSVKAVEELQRCNAATKGCVNKVNAATFSNMP